MHVYDAFHLFHIGPDSLQGDAARGAFEEDVEGFADDADAGPEDERGDDEGENRVDPGSAGKEDDSAADNDCGGGESVASHVDEGGVHIDIFRNAPEQGSNNAVHHDTSGGDDHHEVGLDGYGSGEAMDGFDRDPEGDDYEGGGVDEGCEDTCAVIPEGLGIVRRAGVEVDSDETEQEGEKIRGIVARFRE